MEEDENELIFSGIIEFDGEINPMEKESMFNNAGEDIGVSYEVEDGRGRRIESGLSIGSLESPTSWYTNRGFYVAADLLPGDELRLMVPNAIIPFVDYGRLEDLMNEYKEGLEPVEPTRLFYEDFNPYINREKFIYDENKWQHVDIYQFLGIQNRGDEVLVHEVVGGSNGTARLELSLDGIELKEGVNYLGFEYGGLFEQGDYVEVIARTDEDEELIRVLNQSSLTPDGRLVQGIELPQNTSSIVFSYNYGGGGSE